MKRTIAVFLLSAAAVLAETNGAWTGTITDSMCFQNHAMMNSKNDADCVKECIKSNPKAYKYVLFDGKKSYKLSDQQAPEQYAGRKVVIKGTLFAKTGVIKVDSISAAK